MASSIKIVNRNRTIRLQHTGKQGPAGTIQVGTTTTLPPNSSATVDNVGTATAAILNFGLPQGKDGEGVPTGGLAGMSLRKVTDNDHDSDWQFLTKTDVGLSEVPNLNTTLAVQNQHTHANKTILDATTASYTTADKNRLANTTGNNTGDQDLSAYATDIDLAILNDDLSARIMTKAEALFIPQYSVPYRSIPGTSEADTYLLTSDFPVSNATQQALDTKEDFINKSDNPDLGISDQLYPTQYAVKQYVDAAVSGVPVGNYVLKTGDISTGTQTAPGFVANDSTIGIRSGQATGILRLSGGTVDNGAVIVLGGGSNANIANTGAARIGSLDIIRWSTTGVTIGGPGAVPATHTITLPSTTSGIAVYDTTDQTTNYSRMLSWYNSNTNYYTIATQNAGTALSRGMRLQTSLGTIFDMRADNISGAFSFSKTVILNNGAIVGVNGGLNQSSTSGVGLLVNHTVTQSGTAGYTSFLINPTENTTGSGVKLLIDAQVGGSSKFSVDNIGNVITPTVSISNTSGGLGATTTAGQIRLFGGTLNDGAGFILTGSTNGFPNRGLIRVGSTTIGQWNATGISLGGSVDATHSLTLPSVATGMVSYDTVDQTVNYSRYRFFNNGTTHFFSGEIGGTGTAKALRLGPFAAAGLAYLNLNPSSVSGFVQANGDSTQANSIISRVTGGMGGATGVQYGHAIQITANQSSTAGYTAHLINVTETGTGSGVKSLIDAQVGGVSQFNISNTGRITATNVIDITAGTPSVFFTPTSGSQTEIRASSGGVIYTINRTNGTYMSAQNATGLAIFSSASALAPTHTLTLPSVATGIASYNTADQTTNYERVLQSWVSNAYVINVNSSGTGLNRTLVMRMTNRNIPTETSDITLNRAALPFQKFSVGASVLGAGNWYQFDSASGGLAATSANQTMVAVLPGINQSGTAGYTALLINPTETATGSGAKNLIDAQVNSVSRFTVDNQGNVSGNNIINSTTSKNITVSPTAPASPAIGDIWMVV